MAHPNAAREEPQNPRERLRKRILAADFSKFPGDIGRFSDGELRADGTLTLVNRIEEECFPRQVGENLESALLDVFPGRHERGAFYRFLCLVQYQNKLLGEEFERIRKRLCEEQKLNAEMRDEQFEGTFGFYMPKLLAGADLNQPEIQQEHTRIREQWREKKNKEREAENLRIIQEYTRKRIRSGCSPGFAKSIDWTQPHTVQEYVEAIGEKRVHAKLVRAFLRRIGERGRRRGRGRNKPVEYGYAAGIAVFKEAIKHWMQDNERRAAIIVSTAACQVALPSAVTPEGLAFREVLSPLWVEYCAPRVEQVCPGFSEMVTSVRGWRRWHESLHASSDTTRALVEGRPTA